MADAQETRIQWTHEEWTNWPHPFPRWSLLLPMVPMDGPVLLTTEEPTRLVYTTTDPDRKIRRCSICKEWKPLDEFVASASDPMGRDYQCRPCHRERHRQRRVRAKETA